MEINGKVYRNLPQQVLKNQEDILALKGQTVDSYTKAESDAKFETKEAHQADFNALSSETDTLNQQMATANTDIDNLKKVSGTQTTAISTLQADVERIDPIVPTDIAVHEGKLGLEHNTTWLTNQRAITLGTHLTYDAVTNTLDAIVGATLPAGTKNDPFKLSTLNFYYDKENDYVTFYDDTANYQTYTRINTGSSGVNISAINIVDNNKAFITFSTSIAQSNSNLKFQVAGVDNKSLYFYVDNSNKDIQSYIPALARPSIDGTYNLQITKTGSAFHYDWIAGGGSGVILRTW